MDVLKFTIKGRSAFFKKPDVNTFLYFTYGHIHKVVLMGICGAIVGYKGYSQMSFENKYKKEFPKFKDKSEHIYPEFYERLNHMQIAIVPNEVSISKKVQVFNNSVGYASKELGGNLIVKEQWLENPSWDIYLLLNDSESKKVAASIIDHDAVFVPYLGKNDHLADLENIILLKDVELAKNIKKVDSLFKKRDFEIIAGDDFDDEDEDFDQKNIPIFKYEEKLPIALDEVTNNYKLENFQYTNEMVKKRVDIDVYKIGDKNIVFI